MESKASGNEVGADAAAASEGGGPRGGAQEPDSCCVLETAVKDGRPSTVCVATCCGAAPAAS